MEDSFTKVRNITYDRFVFYSCKQQKGESVESFYGRLIEQDENCSLGSEEPTLIRDAFILNMIDHETQKELLKEIVEPSKALEIAIQMEMGAQNQQKITQNLMTTTNSVNVVNNYQTRNPNANAQQPKRDFTRYPTVPIQQHLYELRPTMESQSSTDLPRKWKKCNNCGITGHFARKCRKPKRSQGQTHKAPQTNFNQIGKSPEKSEDEESVNYITSYQQLYLQVNDSNYDSDSDDYVAPILYDSANQLESLNGKVQFGEVKANAVIDSGIAVSQIIPTTQSAKWITKREKRDLQTFTDDPIKVL